MAAPSPCYCSLQSRRNETLSSSKKLFFLGGDWTRIYGEEEVKPAVATSAIAGLMTLVVISDMAVFALFWM